MPSLSELEKLNNRPMQGSANPATSSLRKSTKPVLKQLPSGTRFQLREWKKAKVHIDYHVAVKRCYYSVPYTLIGKEVEVCLTGTTVEIFHEGKRSPPMPGCTRKTSIVTVDEHRPTVTRSTWWTPERMRRWGEDYWGQEPE
jgi:hypothetical protein